MEISLWVLSTGRMLTVMFLHGFPRVDSVCGDPSGHWHLRVEETVLPSRPRAKDTEIA